MKEVIKSSSRFQAKVSNLGYIIGIRGYALKPLKYGKREYSPYFGVDVKCTETGKIYKTYPIHRLVAEEFLDDWDPDLQVNHKDGDKSNNCVTNLEMVTQSENQRHAFDTGLHDLTKRRGENNWQANFTNEQAIEIKNTLEKAPRYASGKLVRGVLVELSAKYGLTRFQLKDISRGKAWKHIN